MNLFHKNFFNFIQLSLQKGILKVGKLRVMSGMHTFKNSCRKNRFSCDFFPSFSTLPFSGKKKHKKQSRIKQEKRIKKR